MSQFLYPISLLSTDSILHVREFTHKHHKDLVKTIINNNDNLLAGFIDNLLLELIDNLPTLTSLDKLCVLLNIRAYNISPIITFTLKDEDKNINVDINVNDIISNLKKYELQYNFEVVRDQIRVLYSLPKKIILNAPVDIIYDCIDEVFFKGNNIPLDQQNRNTIINKLPSAIFSDIQEQIQKQHAILHKDPLLRIPPTTDIYISFSNQSIIEVIKLFFNTNLRSFYETEYALFKGFKLPLEIVHNSTPAEIGVYCNIISEEIKKQKQSETPQLPVHPKNMKDVAK